ncbi:MAG: hypothetical protein ACKVWV_13415 [Planctomycetota bacterium]
MHDTLRFVFALTFVAACAAAPNPERQNVPAAWTPPKSNMGASTESKATPSTASTDPAAQTASAPASAPTPAAPTPAAPSVAASADGGARAPLVIATVAGSQIDVTELLAQWMHRDSRQVREELDHLVMDRLVLAESRRLGVTVAPEEVEKAYAQATASIETEIQKKRAGLTLDRYVNQMLGLDVRHYRERLRDAALKRELASRVIRAWVLQSEHANIRVIVVKDEEQLKAVQDALAGGMTFEEAARKHSSESSADDGGRVPPVVRSDTTMGRLAFATEVGAVGGPKFEQGAWLLIRVDSRPAPIPGTWPDIRETVEKSLAERGVEDLELSQWQATALERYDVDVTPLLRLVGEPSSKP